MQYLIIGPSGYNNKNYHPGGQVTLTRELMGFCDRKSIKYRLVDVFISQFPRPGFFTRLVKFFGFFIDFIHEIFFHRPDAVVIFTTGGLGLYEKILFVAFCRLLRIKSALLMVDGFFIERVSRMKNLFHLRQLLKLPNFIIAQGENWKNFYEEKFHFKENIVVIHNWAPINMFAQTNVHDSQRDKSIISILFVGHLVKEKGVNELLCISKRLSQNHENVRLILAGSGILHDYCFNEKQLNSLTNLYLEGWCDPKKLNNHYIMSDIFVLPSYAEGFPCVITEAMSFGLPIVATNVGAISDSVIDGYNGYCIEPKNADALYDAITQLVEDKEMRDQFGANSRLILKKNHDPDVCCAKLFDLFK